MPATFVFKPIGAFLNDPKYNNLIEDDDEWVINENITFDYLVSVDLFKSADDTSLHMLFVHVKRVKYACRGW